MKKESKSAQLLFDEAQKHFIGKDIPEAMKLLTSIEQMPSFLYLDPVIRMKTLSLKGLSHLQWSEYTLAEKYLQRSLAVAQEIGDIKAIYIRYENLAAVHIPAKQHQKAIYCLQQAIELKESSGNFADVPRSLIQLSSLQFAIENNEAGMRTLKKASAMLGKSGVEDLSAILHFNTAMQLKREKKYEQALREYSKCIKFSLLNNDNSAAAKAYNNQGDIYMQMGKWKEAREKFNECVRYSQLANMISYVLTSNIQLARIAFELKDLKKCRELFETVSAQAKEADDPMLNRDLAEMAVVLYEAEGDYQSALKASHTFVKYYKKFYDNELSRAVLDMQGKYESEKNERELQKANLKQVESELKALRAQMDPHFIFNALSSMRREMLEGNIENADKYLVRFSKLLRMILDTTRQPLVRLSDNIELLHLYIQIENSRQGNRFDYTISMRGVDPETIFIPGLVLQPLAENAIVHGLNPKKNGRGKLNILFTKSGNTLKIKVTDNGVGRHAQKDKTKESHTSHAMNIIKETLDLIWKEKNPKDFFSVKDLKTNNNQNKGTEVTVLLPLSS
ncbi:MAG: signal transduction histidine kinase, LytS [Bacteroidetes bacterium]|nr:signal transduction histidine kinase, LytS [Bacteroidota bacterium]